MRNADITTETAATAKYVAQQCAGYLLWVLALPAAFVGYLYCFIGTGFIIAVETAGRLAAWMRKDGTDEDPLDEDQPGEDRRGKDWPWGD